MFRRLAPVLIAALTALPPAPSAGGEVLVFAAASLKNALDEIATGFHADTGHEAVISVAGSSVLARQIQLGAPADLFITAHPAWMDVLAQDGRIAPGTRRDLLGNQLVLVGSDPVRAPVTLGPGLDLTGLLKGGRLAMALVDAVPAGIYGKAALQSLGLWDSIAPHVAQTDNVRAALALVASGAAPLGIVYASDARAEPRVRVLATFPADSHPPIRYVLAQMAGRQSAASDALHRYLLSAAATEVFETQGFAPLTPEPAQ